MIHQLQGRSTHRPIDQTPLPLHRCFRRPCDGLEATDTVGPKDVCHWVCIEDRLYKGRHHTTHQCSRVPYSGHNGCGGCILDDLRHLEERVNRDGPTHEVGGRSNCSRRSKVHRIPAIHRFSNQRIFDLNNHPTAVRDVVEPSFVPVYLGKVFDLSIFGSGRVVIHDSTGGVLTQDALGQPDDVVRHVVRDVIHGTLSLAFLERTFLRDVRSRPRVADVVNVYVVILNPLPRHIVLDTRQPLISLLTDQSNLAHHAKQPKIGGRPRIHDAPKLGIRSVLIDERLDLLFRHQHFFFVDLDDVIELLFGIVVFLRQSVYDLLLLADSAISRALLL